jgi:glycosyltransferase involved in cell wall biosynthesis
MCRTLRQAERILATPDTITLLPLQSHHKTSVQLGIGLPSSHNRTHSLPLKREREFRLLYAGRLLEWKGIDIALLALKEIRRTLSQIRLIIVGDGPAKLELERLTRVLGLEDIVVWTGWQPHNTLDQYYHASDLLIFPSLRDSGGMVVLEALAHGLPVVCTDLGGPGMIVDATCGRVLSTAGLRRAQLAGEFAAALRELFSSPALLESLSRGAAVRAQQFTFADLVRSVYADVPIVEMVRPA